MLNRQGLKKKGKEAFYRNWKFCLVVCFIFSLIVGETIIDTPKETINTPDIRDININNLNIYGDNNSAIVNEFLWEINGHDNTNWVKNTGGVLGNVANNVSISGSFLFGILNALNQALFKDHVGAGIVIIVGVIITFIYWIFVSKVIEVGKARFFLENNRYTKTKPNKLFLPYKIKGTLHIAWVMFVKNMETLLWSITIVGPFIKYYSYMLVPYILAENPNIKTKEALKLSQDLMNGHKWEAFKLDLSFLGWQILGSITFNVGNLVFTNPYMNATHANLYMTLRNMGKENKIKNVDLLNDNYLEGEVVFDEYPTYEYNLKTFKNQSWLNLNYKRSYSLLDLILIFFIISFVGWIWEVLLHLFQYGTFVNRGTLFGPWLPIYGAGAVVVLILLKNYRKKPFTYFALSMLICGLIEYFTSVYLEVVHGMKWWNYTGYFLNINGRVCLEGLLFFGIGCVFVTYVAAPLIGNLLDKLKVETKTILCVILVVLMAADFAYSSQHPNQGDGVASTVEDPIQIKLPNDE